MTETLLRGRLLTFHRDPAGPDDAEAYTYLDDAGLLLRDGRIAASGAFADVAPQAPHAPVVDHRPHLMMAGFIDTHIHFPQVQVIASWGAQLLDWLNTYTFPEETRFADPDHSAAMASAFFDQLIAHGTTTAADLGLGKMMSSKKDFIGRTMATREALAAADRHVVVGIKPVDKARRLRSGAHVILKGEMAEPSTDQGYVTSVCFSPTLDQWIGLGLVIRGRERIGDIMRAHDPLRGEDYDIEICNPVFYDPEGGRQRG